MGKIQIPQLQHWIEQRRENIMHPSWILGVPIEQINWHMPVIVGDIATIQPIYVPPNVGRDRQNLARLQEMESNIPLVSAPPGWTRSPSHQEGMRFVRMKTRANLMGIYEGDFEDQFLNISPRDLPIESKALMAIEPGYLLTLLISNDYNLWGRWRHWQNVYLEGELTNGEEIPHIPFCNQSDYPAEMMEFLLDQVSPIWRRDAAQKQYIVHYFLRYMLWAFGHHAQPNQPIDAWDGRAHDRLSYVLPRYMRRLLLFPTAHFSLMLQEMLGTQTIPQSRAVNLAKGIFPGRRNDHRDSLLVMPEPCGTTALAASNHTYEIHGIGTDPWMAIATILDCYLFAPWAVFPFRWLGDRDSEENILTVIARTQMVMDAQKVSPQFFRQSDPDPDAPDLRPFQIVRRLDLDFEQEPDPEIDLAAALKLRLVDNTPVMLFNQAVLLLPETQMWLPSSGEIPPQLSPQPDRKLLPPGQ